MLDFLAGKKTYLVMALGILAAVVGLANGKLTLAEAATAVLGALGLGSLRAGVKKDAGK